MKQNRLFDGKEPKESKNPLTENEEIQLRIKRARDIIAGISASSIKTPVKKVRIESYDIYYKNKARKAYLMDGELMKKAEESKKNEICEVRKKNEEKEGKGTKEDIEKFVGKMKEIEGKPESLTGKIENIPYKTSFESKKNFDNFPSSGENKNSMFAPGLFEKNTPISLFPSAKPLNFSEIPQKTLENKANPIGLFGNNNPLAGGLFGKVELPGVNPLSSEKPLFSTSLFQNNNAFSNSFFGKVELPGVNTLPTGEKVLENTENKEKDLAKLTQSSLFPQPVGLFASSNSENQVKTGLFQAVSNNTQGSLFKNTGFVSTSSVPSSGLFQNITMPIVKSNINPAPPKQNHPFFMANPQIVDFIEEEGFAPDSGEENND